MLSWCNSVGNRAHCGDEDDALLLALVVVHRPHPHLAQAPLPQQLPDLLSLQDLMPVRDLAVVIGQPSTEAQLSLWHACIIVVIYNKITWR